ncbi:hypothetical protein [Nonomuraea sp. NPDC049758]|uniref:hypothetical protein n=1 Tax=Nonomuraea sp. NPDC049758 TaxID=3154360 RepID=UPI003422C75F
MAYGRRGRRTDTALELLPELLARKETRLPDEPGRPSVTLSPAAAMPPVRVHNASEEAAIRRAAWLADGWFPSLISPREAAEGRARLAGQAGRPVPASMSSACWRVCPAARNTSILASSTQFCVPRAPPRRALTLGASCLLASTRLGSHGMDLPLL